MKMKKIKLKYPLIVEGMYDKNRVMAVAEGTVIVLNGFGIFNDKEKRALLRRITADGKLLVLTDSDGAGFLIRNKLKGFLKAENIINLYSPQIHGKEKRKKLPSKEGFLGVEGLSNEMLLQILLPYSTDASERAEYAELSTAMLYEDGLTGKDNSTELRNAFCRAASLPESMTAKALREAINILGGLEFYEQIMTELSK